MEWIYSQFDLCCFPSKMFPVYVIFGKSLMLLVLFCWHNCQRLPLGANITLNDIQLIAKKLSNSLSLTFHTSTLIGDYWRSLVFVIMKIICMVMIMPRNVDNGGLSKTEAGSSLHLHQSSIRGLHPSLSLPGLRTNGHHGCNKLSVDFPVEIVLSVLLNWIWV